MIVIGLIGRIASGKSTVARMLAEHGAEVIDADGLARTVLDVPAIRKEIGERFGPDVVASDGSIRRDVLAGKVFGPTRNHAAALDALEEIVHPPVRERIEVRLQQIRSAENAGSGPAVVVLDVPLLVQAGWAPRCDVLVRVICDASVRARRLAERKLSPEQQQSRDAAWLRRFRESDVPPEKTLTVDASGDLAYTRSQVDRVWHAVLGSAGRE